MVGQESNYTQYFIQCHGHGVPSSLCRKANDCIEFSVGSQETIWLIFVYTEISFPIVQLTSSRLLNDNNVNSKSAYQQTCSGNKGCTFPLAKAEEYIWLKETKSLLGTFFVLEHCGVNQP